MFNRHFKALTHTIKAQVPNKINWSNQNTASIFGAVNLLLLKRHGDQHFKHMVNAMFVESYSKYPIEFDIVDIDGLQQSKSDLLAAASLNEFVDQNCRQDKNKTFSISLESLEKYLAHPEIGIHHSDTTDHAILYGWQDCLYLSNSGGSHHFAVARYIADHLKHPVPLKAKCKFITLDEDAVLAFTQHYHAFLISNEDYSNIVEELCVPSYIDDSFTLIELIEHNLKGHLVCFPKSRPFKPVAKAMRSRFTDFSEELFGYIQIQKTNHKLSRFYSD